MNIDMKSNKVTPSAHVYQMSSAQQSLMNMMGKTHVILAGKHFS